MRQVSDDGRASLRHILDTATGATQKQRSHFRRVPRESCVARRLHKRELTERNP